MCSWLFTVFDPEPEGQACISVFSTAGKEEVQADTELSVQMNGGPAQLCNVSKITQLACMRETLLFIRLLPKPHSFLWALFS